MTQPGEQRAQGAEREGNLQGHLVPLDLHRHLGCLEGRGEALCVPRDVAGSGCTSV